MNLNQPIEVEKLVAAVIEQAERSCNSIKADALRIAADLKAAADTAEAIRKDATSIWNDATVLIVRDGEIQAYDGGNHGPPMISGISLEVQCGRAINLDRSSSYLTPHVQIPPGRYRMVVALLPIKEG